MQEVFEESGVDDERLKKWKTMRSYDAMMSYNLTTMYGTMMSYN